MKSMKMIAHQESKIMDSKRIVTFGLIVAAMLQAVAATPTVSDVVARQRYPWNGMVDIDYTITGDASGCVAEITVEDRQGGKTYTPTKFLSVLPTTEGRHRVTWSTEAEGVTIISTNVAVTVALISPRSSESEDDLCYVVDLSGGPTAESYPVTTMRASPTTVWSDEYKTTKLVLRRIEAGDVPTHEGCRITQPFYIGIFEVTLKQWMLVMDSDPNSYYNTHGDNAAVGCVSYNAIRGNSHGAGWPTSSLVDSTSFLGKLRSKTGLNFDLPTEAQWEYACRAGTTSKYNNGGDNESDLRTLGRYSGNNNDGRGGYSDVTTVGSYTPNAWGLYDMHGNLQEWCLDWCGFESEVLQGDNPKGVASGSTRVLRGGSYDYGATDCTSSSRYHAYPYRADAFGFRLACSAGL